MKKKKGIIRKILSPKWLMLLPVYFYKGVVSPVLPNVCIYRPSCSTYMVEAVKRHGLFKGSRLGAWRILRCAPWGKGGVDLVPDNPKGPMKWLM